MAGSAAPDPGERGDEFDEVVGAIADKRRRFVLNFLARRDAPVHRSTLAVRLAEWLERGDPNEIDIDLYHVHLPKLEAVGLISMDDDLASVTSKGALVDDCRDAYVERLAAACS